MYVTNLRTMCVHCMFKNHVKDCIKDGVMGTLHNPG